MAADDPVDTQALIFSEYDVYAIAGYLAELWGVSENVTADVERAVTSVLR